jgi:hypothetical protein
MTAPDAIVAVETPCRYCAARGRCVRTVYLAPLLGQNRAYCTYCGQYRLNVDQLTTGQRVEDGAALHAAVPPKRKAYVFLRAGGRCELCGTRPEAGAPLHCGHLVGVKEGQAAQIPRALLNDCMNLVALCQRCNLGLGARSFPPVVIASLLVHREAAAGGAPGPATDADAGEEGM